MQLFVNMGPWFSLGQFLLWGFTTKSATIRIKDQWWCNFPSGLAFLTSRDEQVEKGEQVEKICSGEF